MSWRLDAGRQVSALRFGARERLSTFARLFTMPVDGVFPAELPLPMGYEGSYSPDGAAPGLRAAAPRVQRVEALSRRNGLARSGSRT